MIHKYGKFLSLVFLIQIILTAVSLFFMGLFTGPTAPVMLFAGDKNDVSRIEIRGPSKLIVNLERSSPEGIWTLPDLNSFPANNALVDQLIQRLSSTPLGMEVSNQQDSFERLRVATNSFERKLLLSTPSADTEIFFGSTPALRQVHARINDKNTVYAVKFAPGDIDLNGNDWIQKDIFVLKQEAIKSLKFNRLHIERATFSNVSPENKKEWVFSKKGGALIEEDQKNILQLVLQISDMQIDSLALEQNEQDVRNAASLTFSLVLKNGKNVNFNLTKIKDEEDYFMTTSLRSGVFKLPPLSGKSLIEMATLKNLQKSSTN